MGRVGRRNMMATKVYQSTTMFLDSRLLQQVPPWYRAMRAIPPPEILTRTLPPQHQERKINSRIRKPSKLFKPLQLEYPEDRLRKEFYSDHPWELARPRIMLENDGKDGQRCDWSRIQQRGRALDGESVVQRQLWLMNESGLGKNEAYDKARKEFYALRREAEIERRVAKEEALWVGATFGKGPLEIGMGLEDKTYEGWKEWALGEIQTLERMKDAAYTGIGTKNADDGSSDLDAGLDPESPEETVA